MTYTAASRYSALEGDRSPYLAKARECVSYTIPFLLNQGDSKHTHEQKLTSYQSVGAELVTTLSSKMLVTLFPANEPWFKLSISKADMEEYKEAQGGDDEDFQTELDRALGVGEREMLREVGQKQLRVDLFEDLKHKVVCGNSLLYMPEGARQRIFTIDQYCVVRDGNDEPQEIVIKELFSGATLPDNIRSAAGVGPASTETPDTDNHEVYTWVVRRKDGQWDWRQEYRNITVTSGRYKAEDFPYIVGRGVKVSGAHYGRSIVEMYLGDFITLENAYSSFAQITAIASRVLFGVKKGSGISPKRLAETPNGGFFMGDEGDVWTLTVDKNNDIRILDLMTSKIEKRLESAFGSPESIRRNAERVTAEEIRLMAMNFSEIQAGLYALQSEELQLPVSKLIMHRMRKAGQLPEAFDNDLIKPVVTTGLDALGRGNDAVKLRAIAMDLEDPRYGEWINPGDFALRVVNAHGVDADGLVFSKEQMSEQRDQADLREVGRSALPNMIGNELGGEQGVVPQ